MNFTLALMGLTIYILIWEKLPHWGNWFNLIIERLPSPLAYLYEAWRCPYCFGFWISLLLSLITGLHTTEIVATMPNSIGILSIPLAWFLDALVTALLILIGNLVIKAIAGPAISGQQKMQEFIEAMK